MKLTPVGSHETAAHKKSGHTARGKWRKEHPPETRHQGPVKFVCVDGEGQTINGEHRYVLLGIGNDHISDPQGLDYDRIFQFLYDHMETGGTAYTGFFLSYDFTQFIKGISEQRAWSLLSAAGKAKRAYRNSGRQIPRPVEIQGKWEIDILGMKRFKLRPVGARRWMYICDSGPFFQKSFLKVIDPREWSDPIVSQDEYDEICKGKTRRSSATLDDEMIRYNALENQILARVLERLDGGLRELGIHLSPKQWFGPGQAAAAWLEGRAPERDNLHDAIPQDWLEAALASYYGGWFEIMAHGIIPGDIHEYDINSAYPHAISELPCLLHGAYTQGTGEPADIREDALLLVEAYVAAEQRFIGAMPHRTKDSQILRPQQTSGTFWYHEIKAGYDAGIIKTIKIHRWWAYKPCDCPPPFREVRDIYALRKRVGKKTPLGIACKLVPNSLYGKFAQSIGEPRFGNPVYASLITSRCRTKILEAIGTHPDGPAGVMMVATDGVYFRNPHPGLTISGELGEWDHGIKRNTCLFKPGVYWDDKTREQIRLGDAPVFKARGVNARDFGHCLAVIDDMFSELADRRILPDPWPRVTFPLSFSMVTATQAVQRNNWATAGNIITDPTSTQDSNPWLKRCLWQWDGDILRSKSKAGDQGPNYPYERRMGLEDPHSIESRESLGITPDGTPDDLWKEILSS